MRSIIALIGLVAVLSNCAIAADHNQHDVDELHMMMEDMMDDDMGMKKGGKHMDHDHDDYSMREMMDMMPSSMELHDMNYFYTSYSNVGTDVPAAGCVPASWSTSVDTSYQAPV